MKSLLICSLLGLVLLLGQARAECDDTKSPDDSDFTHFFKSVGCKIKKGTEDVADAAKPYVEKIGEGAKDLGSSVSQKFDDLKHRLTDDANAPKPSTPVPYDAPTERVPLAPIAGQQPPLPTVAATVA